MRPITELAPDQTIHPTLRGLGLAPSREGGRALRVGVATAVAGVMVAGAAWMLWRLVDRELFAVTTGVLGNRPYLVAVLVGTYSSAFALRTVAWRWLLTTPQTYWSLLGIQHLSLFANHVLPGKPGDVLRGYLLYRRGVPGTEAAVTTVVARLLDVGALVLIIGVLGPPALSGSAISLGTVALVFTAAVALGAAAVAIPRLPDRVLPALPGPLRRVAKRTGEAVDAVPRGRTAAGFVLLVVPSWLLEAGVLWSVTEAAGVDLSLPAAVAVTAVTIVPQAFQVTPGNLGVYEATMTGALVAAGVEPVPALTVATVTHAAKFLYSYAGAAVVMAGRAMRGGLAWVRRHGSTSASRAEIVSARLWNVLNEGRPFTIVFSAAIFAGWMIAGNTGSPGRVVGAAAVSVPLIVVFSRYAFPLHLRVALWGLVGLFLVWFRVAFPALVVAMLAAYLLFTVVLWGTIYYHWRIGTPLTNFTRFWRLVLENPDTTSANFLEQVPKVFLVTHVLALAATDPGAEPALLAFSAVAGIAAVLVHRWWFTWRPLAPVRVPPPGPVPAPVARRFILIVIDGCRVDRLAEARTPVLDRLAAEGLQCRAMETVYPARTVTGFSTMLTGAPPEAHGLRSNFVPRLGVRCQSVFDVLRAHGRRGRLVGIAHLLDAFRTDVRAVSSVRDNDQIDQALVDAAQDELLRNDPDVLVLQLLSVDQTGHARGSYREEYLERIEATDALIGRFLEWLHRTGFLEGATIGVTSDHGQGRGVGGHGHLGPGERFVPFLLWGAGVPRGRTVEAVRSLADVAPTICRFMGLPPPKGAVGRDLFGPPRGSGPLAIVIPTHDEADNLPSVLDRIPSGLGETQVIVVDDGSTDGTAEVARAAGAVVVRLDRRRGLGAALRAGLDAAVRIDPWAVAYLDGDGEYDPRDIPRLLEPIRRGEGHYVLGSRFRGSIERMSLGRRAGNRVFTALLSILAGRRVSDGQTGMRALSPAALAVAEIVHDYNYAQVLTLDLLAKGIPVAEVPICYRQRRNGRSFVSARYLWRAPMGMVREVLKA